MLSADLHELERLRAEVAHLRGLVADFTGADVCTAIRARLGCSLQHAQALAAIVRSHRSAITQSRLYDLVFADPATGHGPELGIVRVVVYRLRGILKAADVPGTINTLVGSGYQASPDLVAWFDREFAADGELAA